ncbi:hypothetical protein D3C75_1074810 [compost metagenome]
MESVAKAAKRSLMSPCCSIGDSSSFLICRFSSCWQQGTDRITPAFQRTAFSRAASVAVSQAWRVTTISACSAPAYRLMSPVWNLSPP